MAFKELISGCSLIQNAVILCVWIKDYCSSILKTDFFLKTDFMALLEVGVTFMLSCFYSLSAQTFYAICSLHTNDSLNSFQLSL